jgi:hypothetical protein
LRDELAKQKILIAELEKKSKTKSSTKSSTVKRSVNVKLGEAQISEMSPMTVVNTRELQKGLNLGIRAYVRENLYSLAKFIKDDKWAHGITQLMVDKNFVQVPPIGWTNEDIRDHMKPHIYRSYSQIRHNSQSLARRYFMGKKIDGACGNGGNGGNVGNVLVIQ